MWWGLSTTLSVVQCGRTPAKARQQHHTHLVDQKDRPEAAVGGSSAGAAAFMTEELQAGVGSKCQSWCVGLNGRRAHRSGLTVKYHATHTNTTNNLFCCEVESKMTPNRLTTTNRSLFDVLDVPNGLRGPTNHQNYTVHDFARCNGIDPLLRATLHSSRGQPGIAGKSASHHVACMEEAVRIFLTQVVYLAEHASIIIQLLAN